MVYELLQRVYHPFANRSRRIMWGGDGYP